MAIEPEEAAYFYGKPIFRWREQEKVRELLAPLRRCPVDEELKKKVWEILERAKYEGQIHIPFSVVLHRDHSGKYPSYVEVILDTRL